MHEKGLCLITFFAVIHATISKSSPPLVNLTYATYEGTAQSNGQMQFIGIRFAAPPLGDLRFRKPQPPAVIPGIQQANAFGPSCVGGRIDVSEDCLFLNIWAPSNATPKSKLPVFFWIQGGGYFTNSNPNVNGSALIESAGNRMVFVGLNYRVGPFGFLASKKVRDNGDLNVGLLDQRQALVWVQEHITKFGGDPGHVVLVGCSAGSGSIAMHLIANNGQDMKLFAGAFGASPFFPTQMTVPEREWQFDLFASRAGCDGTDDPLACLRGKDTAVLQAANRLMPFPGRTNNTITPYAPTIDGELIVDYPYVMLEEGRFVKVPVVFGDDTDEGTTFARNATSPADVASFLMDQYPHLTPVDTGVINALYPLQAPVPRHAPYFPSLAAAYGDSTLICPGLELSSVFAKHTKAWNYRFNVLTPASIASGLGSRHCSEQANLFYHDVGTMDITPILHAYYTSFVRTLDPNAFPVRGSVSWPQYDDRNQRLLLQLPVNTIQVETVPQRQLDRCTFWKGLSIRMEQ